MLIYLNETELKNILDIYFKDEKIQYRINYIEPENIWIKRNGIESISGFKDARELEAKYPRLNYVINL